MGCSISPAVGGSVSSAEGDGVCIRTGAIVSSRAMADGAGVCAGPSVRRAVGDRVAPGAAVACGANVESGANVFPGAMVVTGTEVLPGARVAPGESVAETTWQKAHPTTNMQERLQQQGQRRCRVPRFGPHDTFGVLSTCTIEYTVSKRIDGARRYHPTRRSRKQS